MAYRLAYSDYPGTAEGPPDPERWVGPQGPPGPQGAQGIPGPGSYLFNVLDYGAKGDGTTNDTTAIQNTINNYAGKGTILIPVTGHPFMVAPLTIPSSTELVIDGTLMLLAGSAGPVLGLTSVSNVIIRGYGTVDGNRTAQSGNSAFAGIIANQCTNITVSGLTVQNAYLWNVVLQSTTRGRLDNVKMLGGRNANGFSVLCDDCWMTNCTIDGPDSDIGFSFYGGVINSGAIGNTVRNSGNIGGVSAVGINVLADSGQAQPCKGIIIADNIITNCSGSGLQSFTDQAALHDGIMFIGNRCSGNGQSGVGSRGGIDVSHSLNVVVEGNHSTNFGNGAGPWWGIYAGAGCAGISIIGNQVHGTGQGGTQGIGLNVVSASALLAAGNFIFDNATTPTMSAALAGTAGNQNTYLSNYFDRPVTLTAAADTVMANVRGGSANLQMTGGIVFTNLLANAANDAGAASAGVAVGQLYRNGSIVMQRAV
jgi:hypothetical protein